MDNFMTKVLVPEEVTMSDVRTVENYRDKLIVHLSTISGFDHKQRKKSVVAELKKINEWISAQYLDINLK